MSKLGKKLIRAVKMATDELVASNAYKIFRLCNKGARLVAWDKLRPEQRQLMAYIAEFARESAIDRQGTKRAAKGKRLSRAAVGNDRSCSCGVTGDGRCPICLSVAR